MGREAYLKAMQDQQQRGQSRHVSWPKDVFKFDISKDGKRRFRILPGITVKDEKHEEFALMPVHQNIGVGQSKIAHRCLRAILDEECPTCDFVSNMWNLGDDEKVRARSMKKKDLYLLNAIEVKKGTQSPVQEIVAQGILVVTAMVFNQIGEIIHGTQAMQESSGGQGRDEEEEAKDDIEAHGDISRLSDGYDIFIKTNTKPAKISDWYKVTTTKEPSVILGLSDIKSERNKAIKDKILAGRKNLLKLARYEVPSLESLQELAEKMQTAYENGNLQNIGFVFGSAGSSGKSGGGVSHAEKYSPPRSPRRGPKNEDEETDDMPF